MEDFLYVILVFMKAVLKESEQSHGAVQVTDSGTGVFM